MNINIRAPSSMLLGYGNCSWNIIKQFSKSGHKVAYFPIGQPNLTTNDSEIIGQVIYNQNQFDYDAPGLTIWHENMLAERFRGKHCVLPFFELNKLDSRRKHHLNYTDLIFCASHWAKQVLENNDVKPSKVVTPMGVDRKIFNENESQKSNSTTFLCLKKIEIRAGYDFIYDIFSRAFTPKDNVRLLISWNNPFLTQEETNEWIKLYKESPLGEKISFLPYFKTDYELAQTIKNCDCGLFPSRAEGFCMPALQSLSCGLQLIITNYSAPTEFCNKENSYLINVDELETAFDGKWFISGIGEWAHMGKNQLEQIIQHMRDIHRKKQEGSLNLNKEGIKTAKQFSWENTCEKLLDGLKNST